MRRILIIDDDLEILRMLERILKKLDYDVVCASGMAQAHDALQASPMDAIVLDLIVGKDSGWQALTDIDQRYGTPVILMTGGNVDEDVRKDAQLLGAKDILQKPFTHESLAAALKAALP